MKIAEMTVYTLFKEVEEYMEEMNGGILDKKGTDIIMKLKMTDSIIKDDMYKVSVFNTIEKMYGVIGDEMFIDSEYSEKIKVIFKEMFNY